jgi:hypothetical protein
MASLIEQLGDLGVGVGVQEPVELRNLSMLLRRQAGLFPEPSPVSARAG